MPTRDFSKYFLYKWRYVIGYSLVAILLISLLLVAGLFLPGGLSTQEMNSVVIAHQMSLSGPSSLAVAHAPYYIAQSLILSVFGVSTFSVKLLSLILALLSAVGLIILLRRWFKPNIAVFAAFIAITTGQFLFIAQSGTPSILYIFWPTALLLFGTQITRGKRYHLLWQVLFAVAVALSLYSPLSLYPLVAVLLAVILHPHLRAAVRKLEVSRLVILGVTFLILASPLVYLISSNSSLALSLLGVPSSWPPDVIDNSLAILKQYFFFWEPSVTTVMTPVFGLGSTLLIALGVYHLIRTRETTRSYLVIIWVLCLIPVLLLNPSFTTVTFIPSIMLLAAGLTNLIGYWYRLFPFNPYARVFGLIPIIILVGVLIVSGLVRYAYGYHYSPSVAGLFSHDLALIPKNTKEIVVGDSEKKFYQAVSAINKDFKVVDQPTGKTFVVTKAAMGAFGNYKIQQIITGPDSKDSDRLYVYQNQ